MSNDSMKKTFIVATLLCIICSVMVSAAVVLLRPMQEENKVLDIRRNLLMAAGLVSSSSSKDDINDAYKNIVVKMVNLETGEFDETIDKAKFNLKKAAKDPMLSKVIDSKADVAKIKTRSKFSKVYFVETGGTISQIVLPVYGKGLWSTMYGFLAISPDMQTVKGFGFYEHGETPGLGGEIDNPSWKALWPSKKVYDENFNILIDILKGKTNPKSNKIGSQVDGLSGATLTTNGVENLIHYWLGADGFKKFLRNFKNRGGQL